jgi:hypothetical protein
MAKTLPGVNAYKDLRPHQEMYSDQMMSSKESGTSRLDEILVCGQILHSPPKLALFKIIIVHALDPQLLQSRRYEISSRGHWQLNLLR